MALASSVKNNFNLSRGFISDASYVNFPEDATVDELNFSIEKDGSRKKRAAVDITYTGTPSQVALTGTNGLNDLVTSSYVWYNPGNLDKKYLVHQINSNLYLYDITESPEDYTSELIYTIDLFDWLDYFQASNSWINGGHQRLQYSAGAGFLFITAPGLVPFIVRWGNNGFLDIITTDPVRMRIRDFEGVTAVDAADPYSYSAENYYNLQNAGWPEEIPMDGGGGTIVNPAFFYLWRTGEEPNTNTPWFFAKLEVADESSRIGKFSAETLKQAKFGTSDPIMGSKLIDPWGSNRTITYDDSLVSDTRLSAFDLVGSYPAGFPTSSTTFADSIEGDNSTFEQYRKDRQDFVGGTFYAGRFFVASGDTVYFSQIVADYPDAGKFYQQNDPTNEQINELLDDDGGTIKIANAGKIVTLKEFSQGVLVCSNNGIWLISGGDAGFTAKNFKVDKITSTPCRAHYNIIDVENIIIMYNEYGIYTLQAGDLGALSLSDVTEQTISQYYTNIGLESILASKPVYDPIAKEFYIFYSDLPSAETSQRYNKVLGAKLPDFSFFKYEISAEDSPNDAFVYDAYVSPVTFSVTDDYQVITSSNDTVIDSSSNNIIIEGSLSSPSFAKMIMLTMVGNASTPTSYYSKESIFDASSLSDFISVDSIGVPYEAFLQTGYMIEEDIMRFKQAPYIQMAFNRTETRFVDDGSGNLVFDRPSSCLLQTYWDWTDHSNSGKIDSSQEVYRFTRNYIPSGFNDPFDNGYPVVTTRNKVRGRGRALHIILTSPEEYDCHLIGWGMEIQGLSQV